LSIELQMEALLLSQRPGFTAPLRVSYKEDEIMSEDSTCVEEDK